MTEKEENKSVGKKILDCGYWYHRIELPNGNITTGWSPICPEKYGVPDDLTGKRVLDVGAWDGYWTWEALKRGASEVVAIDDFSDQCGVPDKIERKKWQTFDLCREAFGFTNNLDELSAINFEGQKVTRIETTVYNIDNPELDLGTFDVIFFFGVNYHLQFPYLALHKLSNICDGEIYIETAALDDYSPYKGKVGTGYDRNDVVMEFYPAKQYGNNENNWWVPTLQCLGAMVESLGFKNVRAWPLSEEPKNVPECRGFVYGSKSGSRNDHVEKLADMNKGKSPITVAAVMSVPRLGFQDNSFCVFEGLAPLGIPLQKVTGAFWGQCLERGIQTQIDTHNPDAILTIDYDTVFKPEDVQNMIKLMRDNPAADVIVAMQMGRGDMQALLTIKSRTGQVRDIIQRDEFIPDLIKVATGHFGLTLIRTSSLLKLPHPWFIGVPNDEGQWSGGRIDDDIYFWKHAEKHNLNVYSANRITIGHMELVIKWPNENLETIYQPVCDYQSGKKPNNVWK